MKNTTKTTTPVVSTTITGLVTDDNRLVISIPLQTPKLTKNQKNYCVANTGDWPNNWVTVEVNGELIGLTLCALVKNPEHPDNKAPVVPVIPPAPKFFQQKSNVSGNGNGTPKTNGVSKRIMPGSMA